MERLEAVSDPCRLFEMEVMVCRERGPPRVMTHNRIYIEENRLLMLEGLLEKISRREYDNPIRKSGVRCQCRVLYTISK